MRCAIAALSALMLGVGLTGCGGKKIEAAYQAQRQALANAALTRPARPARDANAGPYQLAFRLGPSFLDRSLTAMMSENLLESEQVQEKLQQRQAERAQGGAGSGGPGGQGLPTGPFGGRLLETLGLGRGQGGGPSGGVSGWINGEISPTLRARSVGVAFTPDCSGCMKVALDLVGGLNSTQAPGIELGGKVALRSRLEAIEHEGAPALKLGVEGIDSLRIELPIRLPGPLMLMQRGIEETLSSELSNQLLSGSGLASQVVPLGEKFDLGEGVALEGLGLATVSGATPELFLGLNTTLNARSSLKFEERGAELQGADWALLIGDEVVTALMLQHIRSGSIPTRFDTSGASDPEGPLAVDLHRMRFTREGFEIDTRLWYLKFPAWWRDYTLIGTFEMDAEGHILPRISDMVPGEGSGALFVTGLVERKLTSESTLKAMGKKLPTEMPVPLGKTWLARLTPRFIGTQEGALVVHGMLEVVEAPVGPEAPASPSRSRP